jgi:hypothetical protein
MPANDRRAGQAGDRGRDAGSTADLSAAQGLSAPLLNPQLELSRRDPTYRRSAMPPPKPLDATDTPEGARLAGCCLTTAPDQKRYANQYAGSITWIGRYGSAAMV